MLIKKISIILFLVILYTCSSADVREKKILKYYEDKNKADLYEIYLVNPDNYTTMGAEYHRKYYPFLIGIARAVTEDKKAVIAEKSIGFYYDKREDKKNKLYLGIDIITEFDTAWPNPNYQGIALTQLRKYLDDVLYVMQSCKSIFLEKEVVGSVIGIRWEREKINEFVSIWISKNDMIRYEMKDLTFDEIILRSFVTNTEGKVIRLLR